MSALAQILALSSSVIVAYLWLSIPALGQFSLQAFALGILLYFVLKKMNDAKVWEVLPTTAVDEMILVTFIFLILVGDTGATQSVFFPLIYVYLFFVSMTMRLPTAIVITLEAMLFNYALVGSLSQTDLSHLISVPVVMTFFLFAKYQYTQAKKNQTLVEIESNEINSYQIFLQEKDQQIEQLEQFAQNKQGGSMIKSFLTEFLRPKLEQIQEMIEFPQNKDSIKGQLTLINVQIEKLLKWLQT